MYLIYICKYVCIHTYIITEIHVSGQIKIIHQPRAPLILLSTSPLLGTMPHLDKCETFFKLSLQCSPKCRVEISKMWNYPRLIVRKKDLCCITRTFQPFVISVWSLSNCRMLICFWHSGTSGGPLMSGVSFSFCQHGLHALSAPACLQLSLKKHLPPPSSLK